MSTQRIRGAGCLAAFALALGACASGGGTGDEPTVVTFRLWDAAAAEAYEESFEQFTAANPDIRVEVETVPWQEYWTRLPQDLAAGTMTDLFWTNSANYSIHADAGRLLDLTETVGAGRDQWLQSVTDLYTREGRLWGVPQSADSIALFYNADLVAAAGVDVADLTWSPNPDQDSLRPALRELTVDGADHHPGELSFDPEDVAVYGFNAQNDPQAIWLAFLAQNGGEFQDGDTYAFDSPAGAGAFDYLVDLITTEHLAPPAAVTNDDGEASRKLFTRGRLALFQSGHYSLPALADLDAFDWGIAPMVAGPEGRIGVAHGVAALGNADTAHLEETTAVLTWLGSPAGQRPLAASAGFLPAAIRAHDAFLTYWQDRGVDAAEFVHAATGPTTPAPVGPRSNAGLDALETVFPEMFTGRIPVEQALEQAQQAANEAIAD